MDINQRLYYGSLALLVIIGTAVIWGEAIGLTFFIQHLGVEALPYAIIGEALLSMVLIFGFEQIKDRMHDALIVAAICAAGMILLVIGWRLTERGGNLGFGLYYATQRIMRDLLFFYTWFYVSSFFESHTRHLLTRAVLISRIVVIFSGLALTVLTLFFEIEEFIWLWFAVLGVSIIAVGAFADEFHAVTRITSGVVSLSGGASAKFTSALRNVWHSRMLRFMSLGAFSLMFALSLIYFRTVEVYWETFSEDLSLLGWLGIMSSVASLLTLPIQYAILPRAARSTNIERITKIYPTTVSISFLGVLALPNIAVAALADLGSNSMQVSLYDPIQNQMKGTLSSNIRAWGHTFLDAIVEPAGRLVAGIFLVVFVVSDLPTFALVRGWWCSGYRLCLCSTSSWGTIC